jgi:hypothetical protein
VILGSYRTLNGLEAGTAFLVLMATVKLLETRTARPDRRRFISFFLQFAALRSQACPSCAGRVPVLGRSSDAGTRGRSGSHRAVLSRTGR